MHSFVFIDCKGMKTDQGGTGGHGTRLQLSLSLCVGVNNKGLEERVKGASSCQRLQILQDFRPLFPTLFSTPVLFVR